jgi:hypothetical protein
MLREDQRRYGEAAECYAQALQITDRERGKYDQEVVMDLVDRRKAALSKVKQ